MKKLIPILLFPLSCLGAVPTSWVTGHIIDETGTAKTGQITVAPLYSSMLVGTQYVSGARFYLTLTNGGFTNQLINGDYQLLIGGVTSPAISVPGDGTTNNFIDLINTNGLLYQWKSPGSVVKLDSADSTFGFLLDKLAFSSTGFALTTNNAGLNESVLIALNSILTNLSAGIGTVLTNLSAAAITNAVANTYQPTNANLTSVASGAGIAANWTASGTTNATLAGTASANSGAFTNGLSSIGLQLTGTTNHIIFGATNTAPATPGTVSKWISVQVSGSSAAYRIPVYE